MIYFDLETVCIAPMATDFPEFVVMGYMQDDMVFEHCRDRAESRGIVDRAVEDGELLVGHNLAFDLGVLGYTTRELERARIHDTMIVDMFQRLARHDCSREKPGPSKLRRLEELIGRQLVGKGTTQLSFRPGLPLTAEQMEYLKEDITHLPRICERQRQCNIPGGYQLVLRQVQANIALMRLGFNGIRVDRTEIKKQREIASREIRAAARVLQRHGVYEPARIGKKGGRYKAKINTKELKKHVVETCGKNDIEVDKTGKGNIKTDKAFLSTLPQTEIITNYLEYKNFEKIKNTFLRAWDTEHGRIYPKYRGMMRTGRSSSYGPNLQQIPSRGKRGELKRVFLPEEGTQFYELDYGTLELCVLAELTKGRMQELINKGADLHRYLAGIFYNKEESEVTKEERQLIKCVNFGLPGGMGQEKFRQFIRSNGLPDPGERRAVDLKNAWLAAFPEMEDWLMSESCFSPWVLRAFKGKQDWTEAMWEQVNDRLDDLTAEGYYLPAWVPRAVRQEKPGYGLLKWLEHKHVTIRRGHTRRPVSYTEQRNTRFQGLAALLCKRALSLLMDHKDIVINAFVHDSVLISATDTDSVMAAAGTMLAAGRDYLPNTRVSVDICGPGRNWYEAKMAEEHTVDSTVSS